MCPGKRIKNTKEDIKMDKPTQYTLTWEVTDEMTANLLLKDG